MRSRDVALQFLCALLTLTCELSQAQTSECTAGNVPQPQSCFAEVSITITIVEDGYGGQIYWNLDNRGFHSYTGEAGLTGHNGHSYSSTLPMLGPLNSPHLFSFVDSHGDGWHGGWWQVNDGCGRLIGGGPADGQVNGTGGVFEFVGDNATHAACADCPVGRYASAAGLTECSLCPQGRISAVNGSSGCTECPGVMRSNPTRDACLGCERGSFSTPRPCFDAITVSITIASNGWGSEISWNIDGGNSRTYAGTSGMTGHNGDTHMDSVLLVPPVVGQHTFAFIDSFGDGWHGGWWELTDGCGQLIGGGEVDGQVEGHGGIFNFSGTNETGESECTRCPAGRYSNTLGAVECSDCPQGLVSLASGSLWCETCPGW